MIVTYKCPGCGASMMFEPSSQKLHCEHCLTDLTVEEYERKFGEPELREETEEETAATAHLIPAAAATATAEAEENFNILYHIKENKHGRDKKSYCYN